eukprot:TRINITY_DN1064_c0_g1_i3.p1 TRINITY_DN1064_c0_g1~~TRINITY_DN1064_c0_g1_i3.p1  ORF type:complete len:197 (-),score=31.24 TRINITY_DN1064_c0_g1_i3:466-1056(-)
MAGTGSNNSERTCINTFDSTRICIVHRAEISPKFKRAICLRGIISPCSCLLCNIQKVWQSTYAQVHENRIEYNYPGFGWWSCCRCCRILDDVSVNYFDAPPAEKIAKATACCPACTHNSFCPTCCDCCGEAAVVYKEGCCPYCCRSYVMLPGLEDAEAFCTAFNAARTTKAVGVSRDIEMSKADGSETPYSPPMLV